MPGRASARESGVPGCGSSRRRPRPRHPPRRAHRASRARGPVAAPARAPPRAPAAAVLAAGAGRRGASRSARAPSAARSPASRTSRSRRARRRGTTSARSPRSATSAGTSEAITDGRLARDERQRRAAHERGARRGCDQRDGDRRPLERQAGLGQRALHRREHARTPRPAAAGRARTARDTRAPSRGLGPDAVLIVPSGEPHGGAPTSSARARARRSGGPCRRGGASPCREGSDADACRSPGGARRGDRPPVRPARLSSRGEPAQRVLQRVAASRLPYSRPSTETTGITSRTDDEVKASSAASSRSSGKAPGLDVVARAPRASPSSAARVSPARMPSSSAGVTSTSALAPPDVRHRALEHRAVEVDEHRIVRAAPLRLGLRRGMGRVARPTSCPAGARAPNGAGTRARRAAGRAHARARSSRGSRRRARSPTVAAPGAPGVQ